MRGIEAEAKEAKPILRSHKGDLDLETIIPDHFDAQGSAFTQAFLMIGLYIVTASRGTSRP